jgi:hypothetical protein
MNKLLLLHAFLSISLSLAAQPPVNTSKLFLKGTQGDGSALNDFLVRDDVNKGEVKVRPLSSIINFGTSGEVPFTNSGGTNFSYSSAQFQWIEDEKTLLSSEGLTLSSSNYDHSLIVTHNSTISADFRWSGMLGDEHSLTNSASNDTFISGWNHIATGGGFGGSGVFGSQMRMSGSGTKGGNLFFGNFNSINQDTYNVNFSSLGGQNHLIDGLSMNVVGIHMSGLYGHVTGTGTGAFVHGFNIGGQTTRRIIASGNASINMSSNSSSQGSGNGALANYCGIFAGRNGHVASTAVGSVTIGGYGLSVTDSATVKVPNLIIDNKPRITEGSNKSMGVSTLSAGTVTVNNTLVTANSRIFLSIQSLGTVSVPQSIGVTARSAGTSFTITSEDNTDTSVVAWIIFEPN